VSHLRCKGAEVYVGEGSLAVDWGPDAGLRVPAQWCTSVTMVAGQDTGAQLVFQVRTGVGEATGFLKFRLDVDAEGTDTAGRFVEDIRRECGIEDVDEGADEDADENPDEGDIEDVEGDTEDVEGVDRKVEGSPLLRVPYGDPDWIGCPAGPATEELYVDVVDRLMAQQAGLIPDTD